MSNPAFQRAAGCRVLCEAVWLWAGPFPVPAGWGPAQPSAYRVRGHALVPGSRDPAGLSQVSEGMGAWHFSTTPTFFFSLLIFSVAWCSVMSAVLFSRCTIKLLRCKNLLMKMYTFFMCQCAHTSSSSVCYPFSHQTYFSSLKPTALQNLLENISPLFEIEAMFFDRPSQNIP